MRVVVLGGTGFTGSPITADLRAHGHDVVVVHRGNREPAAEDGIPHVHVSRADLASVRDQLGAFDALVEVVAMTRTHARQTLDVVTEDVKLVVLSSVDVYRAYGALLTGTVSDAVPFDETDPVRPERYPLREQIPQLPDYEKIDVEEEYLARGGTVLRLPMIYGEGDRQRREEFILRRVRADRKRIPIGPGTWLSSRCYVGDVAQAVRLALESDRARGEIFNVTERRTETMAGWAQRILDAAGSSADLVRVPEHLLPADMEETGSLAQHLLCDGSKARFVLGFRETPPEDTLARSVRWHLANPPEDAGDFEGDDRALAEV